MELTKKDGGLQVSPELFERYLENLTERGRSADTRQVYRRRLAQFYELLPEDKTIRAGTLTGIRQELAAQGTPHSTVNILCSAVNGLLEFCGRRELQVPDGLGKQAVIAPELTRTEYLRLLAAARTANRERPYFLVKTIANTGIHIRELPLVTVAALEGGLIRLDRGNFPVSPCLREELLDYCRRRGIFRGAVFVTEEGRNLHRSAVNGEIKRLAADARVDPEKCTPLALRRLYLATQEQIQLSLAVMAQQSHDRLFEKEQRTIGWENSI